MARRQILRDPLQSRIRQLRDAHEHQFQERGLERRVDLTATAAFDQAVMPNDSASTELAEAWSRAYGRDPDPSDVWDHSIMAVEAILQKIISPDNNSTTLGTLIKNLRDGAHKFEFVLTNDQGGVQTLLAMLQLMWPNPDRHGGPNGRTEGTVRQLGGGGYVIVVTSLAIRDQLLRALRNFAHSESQRRGGHHEQSKAANRASHRKPKSRS